MLSRRHEDWQIRELVVHGRHANELVTYVQNNPGSNSERISATVSTDSGTLRPAMRKLIDEGKVKPRGEKRARAYSLVGA